MEQISSLVTGISKQRRHNQGSPPAHVHVKLVTEKIGLGRDFSNQACPVGLFESNVKVCQH